MTTKPLITLYGNVGGTPETRTLPAKEITTTVYDPIIDETLEREYSTPERELRTFSIAVTAKDSDQKVVTRWIRCTDWNNLSHLIGKGDRIRVQGRFRERQYEKNGETKTAREFVIEALKIERLKTRVQAA